MPGAYNVPVPGEHDISGDHPQDLAKQNIGLAQAIARRYHRSLQWIDYEETSGEALMALVKAAESFDSAKGQFPSYAATVIENRMRDYYEKQQRIHQTMETTLDAPTPSSLLAPTSHLETPKDQIATPEVDPARQAHRNEMTKAISQIMGDLGERQRLVLQKVMEGLSYQQIADELDISKQAVQQMARRSFPAVQERLEQDFGNRPLFMPSTKPINQAPPQRPTKPSRPSSKPILATLWRKITHLCGRK